MNDVRVIGTPVRLVDASGTLGVVHAPPPCVVGDVVAMARGPLLKITRLTDDGRTLVAEVERVRMTIVPR